MCGIAGILSLQGPLGEDAESRLRAAAASLAHRGPDDEGFYRSGEMGLAFRRLSILDLAGGHQPMGNEDGSIQVVFNGEIYNFRELTERLKASGHVFKTRSDTEVLVHLYEEVGEEFARELRGMFAIALWDSRRHKLLLVRDRLGIKPLFYRQDGKEVCFASEIKGILAMLPMEARRPDHANLTRYLALGYFSGTRTAFEDIQKLAPAHRLVFQDGGQSLHRYWSLPAVEEPARISRGEAVERLRELLEESVRLRLISDVPLGAFLSGGVDSSCVVSLMRRISPDQVKTFTVGFEYPEFNEIPIANLVSSSLGTQHHTLVVRPDAVGLVDQVVSSFDEPFGDPSAIPTYLVSRLARRHVTVVLSGDGGDELFAGYGRYRSLRKLEVVRWVPPGLRRRIASLLRRTAPGSFQAQRVGSFLERSTKRFPEDYLDSVNFLLAPHASQALNAEWLKSFPEAQWEVGIGAVSNPVEGAQRLDLHHYLPEDILAKVDRMSMACSLEARVPLLDHRVVEFVSSLPPEWKQAGDRPKSLLLDAAGRSLPSQVWNRRKMGFGIPLSRWFRGELKEYLADILLGSRARQRGIWNPSGVEALLKAHAQGTWDLSEHLWSFLTLEVWWQKYLDPVGAARSEAFPARVASAGGRGFLAGHGETV
ncbi:MAG: asparagine synthase (glutamine-hydrolyzing) [Acidobacteria bacterium]|nr:asparagine synthase (glutamine-hydrolyzing) [Acidobacteriota bacterium]